MHNHKLYQSRMNGLDLFGVFSGKNVDLDSTILEEIESQRKKRKVTESQISGKEIVQLTESLSPDQLQSSLKSVETVELKANNTETPAIVSKSSPAKVYPFELDSFQKEAIGYIERNESVLVAAHTSAGKTAVAEYAIAKSLRDKQRVIYTSPIKALSNQKFRDLNDEFEDVGLMTGDMTINPNATCLIMTTEILRSMLYRGSEVIREVAWVIYDEVHYMRDKERGVVWEESIILLPHKIRFVFLSATIPNSQEFVDWVAKIHKQPCNVVYTDYRPTPLQHFVFPAGSEGLFLVVDEKGKFRDDNFQKAMSILQQSPQSDIAEDGGKSVKKAVSRSQSAKNLNSGLFKIVRLIMDRELDPCIIFSFSKKECETYALQMARLDFNSSDEKNLVEQVFNNAMEVLSEDDRSLPQVVTILPLLKRGIGIHHGGLLPILKEVIEILFQEGLIKCLFATETFSIGINMPAKTVVFTKTRKFDGKDFRWISSGEYIQMSGRAGRRGKDDKGIVIQMLDEKMEPDVAKDMIYGASDPLHSSYHVSYNMLLNMMRVEDADPENILRASFHQFQQEQGTPKLLIKADELLREAQSLIIPDELTVASYFSLRELIRSIHHDIIAMVMKPEFVLPFLQPGRLLHILSSNLHDKEAGVEEDNPASEVHSVPGIVINVRNATSEFAKNGKGDYKVDVLIESNLPESPTSKSSQSYSANHNDISLVIIPIALSDIRTISAVRLNVPKDLTSVQSKQKMIKSLKEVERRFNNNFPLLDPIVDFGITNPKYSVLNERLLESTKKLTESTLHIRTDKEMMLNQYFIKTKLMNASKTLISQAKESQSLTMKDTMRRMRRVLKRLQYVTEDGVLSPKGRFACELTTGDELVLTDMVFDGIFNDLTVQQIVAILSCFVHKESAKSESPKLKPEFEAVVRKLHQTARNVCRVSNEAKIEVDEEEYVNSFNTLLVEVAYLWSGNAKFVDICRQTDIFEGSIIRSLRRLEELLRQLASASFSIGNHELKSKFESGADSIRRGVVFAASLYI